MSSPRYASGGVKELGMLGESSFLCSFSTHTQLYTRVRAHTHTFVYVCVFMLYTDKKYSQEVADRLTNKQADVHTPWYTKPYKILHKHQHHFRLQKFWQAAAATHVRPRVYKTSFVDGKHSWAAAAVTWLPAHATATNLQQPPKQQPLRTRVRLCPFAPSSCTFSWSHGLRNSICPY